MERHFNGVSLPRMSLGRWEELKAFPLRHDDVSEVGHYVDAACRYFPEKAPLFVREKLAVGKSNILRKKTIDIISEKMSRSDLSFQFE